MRASATGRGSEPAWLARAARGRARALRRARASRRPTTRTGASPTSRRSPRPPFRPRAARAPSRGAARRRSPTRPLTALPARVRERPLRAAALVDARPAGAASRVAEPRRGRSRRPSPASSSRTSRGTPRPQDRPFVALNTAFFRDGAFIHVPRGASLAGADPPRSSSRPATARPSIVASAHRWSSLERGRAGDGRRELRRPRAAASTSRTRSPRSSLARRRRRALHKLQRESAQAFHVAAARRRRRRATARFASHAIALGGATRAQRRRRRRSTARAPSARSTASTWRPAGSTSTTTRRSTTRSRTARAASSTRASSTATRAACSTARSSSARTRRRPTRKQTNQNLLLSDDATIDTKPELEIYADDVKCTHGATVGQLDDDALFYLRSRGIGEDAARRLLVHAFASEIIDQVKVEPRPRPARRMPARRCASTGARHEGRMKPRRTSPRRARPRAASTSSASARTSRSSRAASTASRSSTSTTPPRRRSRAPVIDAHAPLLRGREREHPPRRPPLSASARPRAYEGAREQGRSASSNAARAARDRLHARHDRGDQPRRAELRPRARRSPATRSLVTAMEHHSNIVPWQMLCDETGATLRVAPIDDAASCVLDELEKLLAPRTKHRRGRARLERARARSTRSREIVALAHARGRRRCWSTARRPSPHLPVDVQALGCDFYAFSGHKLYGPTGIGVLYGKASAARGDAAVAGRRRHDPLGHASRRRPTTTLPYKFEAGTPEHRRRDRPRRRDRLPRRRSASSAIAAHEHELLAYATAALVGDPRRCASSARRARRPASSRSCSTASTRTTSARSSTARASRSARATTARSR